MADDNFGSQSTGLTSPGEAHRAVVPSDDDDLDPRPRCLKCIADGDVAVRDKNGVDITYPMLAGELLEFRAVRVLATGTTATVVAWE
jgi:hypothetical protein